MKIEKQQIKLEGCLTVHLPREIKYNANLMQLGNFINVFLAPVTPSGIESATFQLVA